MRMMRRSIGMALLFLAGLASPGVRADYAVRDGDTVVFLGDSITAARTYGKIVENYTLLRFPDRKVRFINAGWGGDTAAGGLERLDRDVFAHGATVLIVAYGINDIGWGMKADDEHKQALPRRDPGHRRALQGAQGPRLHLLGGDHRRGPRQGRGRIPPGDVRRGDGDRSRARAKGRSTSSAPCGRSRGRSAPRRTPTQEREGQADPPRRRRHPPERPRPAGDGVRDPQGAGRAGRRLVGDGRRARPRASSRRRGAG